MFMASANQHKKIRISLNNSLCISAFFLMNPDHDLGCGLLHFKNK